jgi:hypothetical protein
MSQKLFRLIESQSYFIISNSFPSQLCNIICSFARINMTSEELVPASVKRVVNDVLSRKLSLNDACRAMWSLSHLDINSTLVIKAVVKQMQDGKYDVRGLSVSEISR